MRIPITQTPVVLNSFRILDQSVVPVLVFFRDRTESPSTPRLVGIKAVPPNGLQDNAAILS